MKQVLALLLTLFSFSSIAAPKAELWDLWNESNEQNDQTISHQLWQIFLDHNLERKNEYTLINYGEVNDQEKRRLDNYIHSLTALDPRTYNRAEQYAYWVNLYNALTVKIILDNYPIKSITKLGGLFSFGPWGDKITTVSGHSLTLNDIEHRILRPIWQDPRTHYAVNCASLGCPNLQPQAFTATNSEQLLEKSAKEFINSDKGVFVERGKTRLSSIYEWFAVDFGGQAGLIDHLSQYRANLPADLGKISYEYDWSLNQLTK